MSKRDLQKVNKIYRTIVIGFSIIMAITALIYNPAHLFTAGLIFSFGMESELVKAEETDIE